mmetsp:Transcript_18546/g.58634  ORF Transcript_18546/g.58634 Transcript_18546/m.58634 type:complete len:208 (-) Transcript_18546:1409-2032(-)
MQHGLAGSEQLRSHFMSGVFAHRTRVALACTFADELRASWVGEHSRFRWTHCAALRESRAALRPLTAAVHVFWHAIDPIRARVDLAPRSARATSARPRDAGHGRPSAVTTSRLPGSRTGGYSTSGCRGLGEEVMAAQPVASCGVPSSGPPRCCWPCAGLGPRPSSAIALGRWRSCPRRGARGRPGWHRAPPHGGWRQRQRCRNSPSR